MVSKYFVSMTSHPNPDLKETVAKAPPQNVIVNTMRQAVAAVRSYIACYDLGGGNFPGAKVIRNYKHVATISYNGRIWKEKKNAAQSKLRRR